MNLNRDVVTKVLSWFYEMESGMIKKVKKKVFHKKKTENFISVLKKMVGGIIVNVDGIMETYIDWDEMEYMERDPTGKFSVKRNMLHDMKRAFNKDKTDVWMLDFCEVAKSFRNLKTGNPLSDEQREKIFTCIQKYIEDVYMQPFYEKKLAEKEEDKLTVHEEVMAYVVDEVAVYDDI